MKITGIHNSIEMTKRKKFSPNNSFSDSSPEVGDISAKKESDSLNSDNKIQSNKEDSLLVPTFSNLDLNSEAEIGGSLYNKKSHTSLTLELTKAYDFSPSSTPGNKRYFLNIGRLKLLNLF